MSTCKLLKYSKMIMYADDTSMYTEGESLFEIQNKLQVDLENVVD